MAPYHSPSGQRYHRGGYRGQQSNRHFNEATNEEPSKEVDELVQKFKQRGHFDDLRRVIMHDFLNSQHKTDFNNAVLATVDKFLTGNTINARQAVDPAMARQRERVIMEQLRVQRVFSKIHHVMNVEQLSKHGASVQLTLEVIATENDKAQERLEALKIKREQDKQARQMEKDAKAPKFSKSNADFADQLIQMALQASVPAPPPKPVPTGRTILQASLQAKQTGISTTSSVEQPSVTQSQPPQPPQPPLDSGITEAASKAQVSMEIDDLPSTSPPQREGSSDLSSLPSEDDD